MSETKVLIVDDDYASRLLISKILETENYITFERDNGLKAVECINSEGIDLVITDLKMEGMDGIELLEEVKKDKPHIGVILVTGYASIQTAIDAMRLGAIDYLKKPINVEELRIRVRKALERLQLEKKISEIERRLTYSATVTTANHEINQPLTVILSGIDMLKMELTKMRISDNKIPHYLHLIEKSSHRIANILRKLRQISVPVIHKIPHGLQMIKLQVEERMKEMGDRFILVIEDEEQLRQIVKDMLENEGFKVILAANAKEGIEIYKTQYQFIELVLLDYNLPDASGGEVFEKLKNLNSKVKILITSGFEFSEDIQNALDNGALGFLSKPFDRELIIQSVQKIFSIPIEKL
jgi:DNA-binding NtrC family response regulator